MNKKNKKGFDIEESDNADPSNIDNLGGSKNPDIEEPNLEDIPEEIDEVGDEEEIGESDPDEEENEEEDEELKEIRKEFEALDKENEKAQFPRIESKPQFASEVINTPTNQKVANLEEDQISDLLRKRRFMNLCHQYGWNIVSKMAGLTVADIENYSLSKKGFLVDNVLNEKQKQAVYNVSRDERKKRRSKEWKNYYQNSEKRTEKGSQT